MTDFITTTLKKIAKQTTLALVGIALCFGLIQAPAHAATATTPASGQESLSEMRAERRAENSRASQSADTENADNSTDSIGETIKEKLNLDEMVEDNVLLGNDYEPDEANTGAVSK